MFGCACPAPAALTTIPSQTCGENIGQIQKIMFQRRQPTASPTVPVIADAGELATWTALKIAVGDTKVVVTPFAENVVIPPAAPITEGGDDNTTINGAQIVVGASAIPVTGVFRSLAKAVLKAIKTLNCEDVNALSVFLINNSGQIIGQSTTDVSTDFRGIPITSFFIGDPGAEGLNTHDKAPFQWNFAYGWRDKLTFVTPTDFDALVDL